MMDARSASLEWIDEFSFQMFHADTLKACLHAGVSWLSDWIDLQFSTQSDWVAGARDYQIFCRSMASEVDVCEGDEEELRIWSWGMAAEMFDLYEKSGGWTEEELLEYFRVEITDVELKDRERYARHLFVSAIAFIHGWVAYEAGFRDE
jgi:hypothetical protein